jgi:hypothetical protein
VIVVAALVDTVKVGAFVVREAVPLWSSGETAATPLHSDSWPLACGPDVKLKLALLTEPALSARYQISVDTPVVDTCGPRAHPAGPTNDGVAPAYTSVATSRV